MERIVKQIKFQKIPQASFKRVAAYARVSTGKDAMLHSLSAQVSYYSQLIQNHCGWEYAGVYTDEALTGTRDDREGFQKLISECRAGNVDMIITKSISRFSRNTLVLLETVRELKSLGVDVFFEEQNIHSDTADGELMLTILASYAQEESLSASENQKWRIRKGFENGELMCLRHLLGYKISKGRIEIDEKTAPIVREIFQRAIAGESFGSIARYLNTNKKLGVYGGEWTARRVSTILGNEKYCGNALLQKRYRNNHIDKRLIDNKGSLPQYFATETHDAIIDCKTFEAVQKILKGTKEIQAQSRPRERTIFTGIIVCGNCGAKYKRISNHGRKAWNCTTFQTQGKSACHTKQIPEEELYRISAEVLNIAEFDAEMVIDKITEIRAEKDNTLVFCFKDGTKAVKRWQSRSRKKKASEGVTEI